MTVQQRYPKGLRFFVDFIRRLDPAAKVACSIDAQGDVLAIQVSATATGATERIAVQCGWMDSKVQGIRRTAGRARSGARCRMRTCPCRSAADRGDDLLPVFARSFFRRLPGIIDDCVRQTIPVTFMMIDVDCFKRVNDTYGHLAGDAVLKTVASLIRKAVSEKGSAFRYGGEEIGVVLPNATQAEAEVLAERMRASIAAHPFVVEGPRLGPVTVSIGLSTAAAAIAHEQLVHETDLALLSSKRQGRNRITVFSEACASIGAPTWSESDAAGRAPG